MGLWKRGEMLSTPGFAELWPSWQSASHHPGNKNCCLVGTWRVCCCKHTDIISVPWKFLKNTESTVHGLRTKQLSTTFLKPHIINVTIYNRPDQGCLCGAPRVIKSIQQTPQKAFIFIECGDWKSFRWKPIWLQIIDSFDLCILLTVELQIDCYVVPTLLNGT